MVVEDWVEAKDLSAFKTFTKHPSHLTPEYFWTICP